jgi:hypothetical protein
LLHLLKNISESFSHFQEFYNFIENQYDAKIKMFWSDNIMKFINKKISNFFKQKVILHQTTCVYTWTKWCFLMKKIDLLLEMTRFLLFQNNILKIFWSDAVLTATYLINRLSSSNLNYKSPMEILYQRNIILNHLRLLRCTCFVHKSKQDKLDYNRLKLFFWDILHKKWL